MEGAAILAVCLLISLFIGYWGRNRKLGFWGYFFATLLLTPLVGLILVLVSDKKNSTL
jgi:uncharacterized membrane protein YiaA